MAIWELHESVGPEATHAEASGSPTALAVEGGAVVPGTVLARWYSGSGFPADSWHSVALQLQPEDGISDGTSASVTLFVDGQSLLPMGASEGGQGTVAAATAALWLRELPSGEADGSGLAPLLPYRLSSAATQWSLFVKGFVVVDAR